MVDVIRVALAPLVRGSTYRRGVYLLLGGVVLLPYVLLGVAFAARAAGGGDRPPGRPLVGVDGDYPTV
jgi:hypothetical protein